MQTATSHPIGTRSKPDSPSRLRFGEFELHCETPELWRGSKRIELPLQPLKVLVLLASRRGQVVASDEIARVVWGKRVVSWPDSLHVCIRQLRRALGENADNASFIETVPRRGYRLMTEVETVSPDSPEPKRPALVASSVVMTLALAILGSLFLYSDSTEPFNKSPGFEAFAAYEKGAYLLAKFPSGDWRLAQGHFEDAVEADPDYAAAWAGLADVRARLQDFDAAESALDEARALAPESPDVLRVSGDLHLFRDWSLSEAESYYLKAIDADPSSAKGHQHYSMVLAARGQMGAAIEQMERALAIEPVSTIINADLGWYYYLAGDYDASIKQCQAALDIEPSLYFPHFCLLESFIKQGEKAQAVEEAKDVLKAWGGDPESLIGSSEGALANFWQQYLALLEEHSQENKVSPMSFAYAYAGLGDATMTMHWLDIAYEERAPGALFARANPSFEFVRHNFSIEALSRLNDR